MNTGAFWSGKRVLLTGHTGFKGAWAALWLERLGAEVTGLALAPDAEQSLWEELGRPGGDHNGDVRDPATVRHSFVTARPEIVLHMAAQALVQSSYEDPVTTFETNVMGLVQVLDAARTQPGVRAVVVVTSDKCYENVEHIWAYRETERMGGSDPYSASKGCAELVTASYLRSFFRAVDGPRLASARAGNVIGGGDWARSRLIPDCIRAWQTGEAVKIRNPLAIRPWQHVLEPVSGYLALAQALCERGAEVAEGWNFGPGDRDSWTVGQAVDRLVDLWGNGAAWRQDEAAWPKEAMLLRVDATKARLRLGWTPTISTDEALNWTASWYHAVLNGASARQTTLEQIAAFETRQAARP